MKKETNYVILLSTTYGFNNSHTKRLRVRLRTTNKGVFKSVVKLSGIVIAKCHQSNAIKIRFYDEASP